MIRIASALSLLISCLLAGNTFADPTPEDRAYIGCLIAATQRLDDHRSDAATVAQAIQGVCSHEWQAEKEEAVRDMNPTARQMTIEKLDQKQLQLSIQVVLTVRSKSSSAPPN